MSFPRLDKGSVPRASGRNVSAIATSRRAETDESESLPGAKGGSDRKRGRGIVGNTSGPFCLTKRDVIAAGVGASVSPRRLTELFSPSVALKQPTQLSECVSSSLAEPVGARFPNSDPPGSKTDDVVDVFEECGLFDDLAPEGMPREGWSPKRLIGGHALSETALPEGPKPGGERRENLTGEDTVFQPSAMVAAVETAIESSTCEKSSPMEPSSNRLGSPKCGQGGALREDGSQSGEREASVDTRRASIDEQPLAVDAENERDAVVTMTARERGVARWETGGTGWGRGGGGTVGSSSAPETQVGAISEFCGIKLSTQVKQIMDAHRVQTVFFSMNRFIAK